MTLGPGFRKSKPWLCRSVQHISRCQDLCCQRQCGLGAINGFRKIQKARKNIRNNNFPELGTDNRRKSCQVFENDKSDTDISLRRLRRGLIADGRRYATTYCEELILKQKENATKYVEKKHPDYFFTLSTSWLPACGAAGGGNRMIRKSDYLSVSVVQLIPRAAAVRDVPRQFKPVSTIFSGSRKTFI